MKYQKIRDYIIYVIIYLLYRNRRQDSMYINIEDIDINQLRKDLIDYYTSAMFIVSGAAMIDLINVEKATDEEIIKIAINNNFDLNNYINIRKNK